MHIPVATLVGDTRMTVYPGTADQQHFDELQKVHQVSPFIIAGFSGDVRTGFAAISALRRLAGHLPNDVRMYLDDFASGAQKYLANAYTELDSHAGPVRLLVAGLFHRPDWPEPQLAACLEFASPAFEWHLLDPGRFRAIGSGGSARVVESLVGSLFDAPAGPVPHVRQNAQLWLDFVRLTVADFIVKGWREHDYPSVGREFVQGAVNPRGVTIKRVGPTDPRHLLEELPPPFARPLPRLLRSWAEAEERIPLRGCSAEDVRSAIA